MSRDIQQNTEDWRDLKLERDGNWVYALVQDGWDNGKPQMCNRFHASVQPHRLRDELGMGNLEPKAEQVAAVFAASFEMRDALKGLIQMLEGESGASSSHWEDVPEYQAAVKALQKAEGEP
jgi:hypothetical protein